MITWHQGPLCPFDTETTGKYVETDEIVTATVARITPAVPTHFSGWMIAVTKDIHPEATKIHGITTEQARANGRPAVEVLDEIADELVSAMSQDIPIVGMNLVFDFTILDRNLRRAGLTTVEDRLGRPIRPVIDASVLDKHVDPFRPGGRKLTDLCVQYGVRIDGAHDAEFDAMAATRIAYRIAQMSNWDDEQLLTFFEGRKQPKAIVSSFASIRDLSLDELHNQQIVWRVAQQNGLRGHFTKVKKEHDGVPVAWPMLPFVDVAVPA